MELKCHTGDDTPVAKHPGDSKSKAELGFTSAYPSFCHTHSPPNMTCPFQANTKPFPFSLHMSPEGTAAPWSAGPPQFLPEQMRDRAKRCPAPLWLRSSMLPSLLPCSVVQELHFLGWREESGELDGGRA